MVNGTTRHTIATYRVRASVPLQQAGELIAHEQSAFGYARSRVSSTAVASVVSVKQDEDSLDSEGSTGTVSVAFPPELHGERPSQLLNVVAGEVHHLQGIKSIRLVELQLPPSLEVTANATHDPIGDMFGERLSHRPLFCCPIKPPVGLSDNEFVSSATDVWLGGFDIVKDDELLWIEDAERFAAHAEAMVAARDRAQQRTGDAKAYVANLLAGGRTTYERLAECQELNVDGVLVPAFLSGFDTLRDICREFSGFVMVHNSFMTTNTRLSTFGVSMAVYAQLSARCGADIFILPSPWGSFLAEETDVTRVTRQCGQESTRTMLPALSGGKTVVNLQDCYELVGSTAFCVISGGAVCLHPDGPQAGAMAFGAAWSCISRGRSLSIESQRNPALAGAITWARDRGLYGPSATDLFDREE